MGPEKYLQHDRDLPQPGQHDPGRRGVRERGQRRARRVPGQPGDGAQDGGQAAQGAQTQGGPAADELPAAAGDAATGNKE